MNEYLLSQLWEVRNCRFDPHPNHMSFLGYIAACWHLDALHGDEYSRLVDLSRNAAEYCRKDLV
jgi:hypothetical protein